LKGNGMHTTRRIPLHVSEDEKIVPTDRPTTIKQTK
jgi:hypothetical protein